MFQETPAAAATVDVQELRVHARDLIANAGANGSLLEMLAAVKQDSHTKGQHAYSTMRNNYPGDSRFTGSASAVEFFSLHIRFYQIFDFGGLGIRH